MHVGLVGAGRIGSCHASVLSTTAGVQSLTIADADAARARRVADAGGAAAVATPEELIGARVDALVIAAATPAHAELIELGCTHALPVFCEKPIALDLETTDRVIEAVRASGILLQMGFQRRFDAGYVEARRLVASGELGTVYVVRASGHDPAPPPELYISESGGIFRDLHVHDFDVIRFVTGQEIVEVYADGAVLIDGAFGRHDDVDVAVATMRLSGGALAIMSGTRHDPLGYDIRMEVLGSRDSIGVGIDARLPLRSVEPGVEPSREPAWANFMERFEAAYRAELAEFVRLAASGGPSPCTAEDAKAALVAAIAADASRHSHQPVATASVTDAGATA